MDKTKAHYLKYFVFILFFASGISGLMYEVVWLRMLTRMMGVTIYATSTVLGAFMAGLALGSFIIGRYIDRRQDPLKVYSVLELLIGITAIFIPFGFLGFFYLYEGIFQLSGESTTIITAVRAVLSFLLLLIPTTLMGGTLPVMTSWLVRKERVFGKSFGLLYGLNTLGAVGGVFISGFITIGAFGEWATILIGVVINLMVSILAFFIYIKESGSEVEKKHERLHDVSTDQIISPYSDLIRRVVLISFALSGFTALAYEVIWTRQLILFLKTSIYAFSGMLVIFLSGIALGSFVMNKFLDRVKAPLLIFGLLEVVIGLISIGNLYLIAPLDSRIFEKLFGLSSIVLSALIIVFPLTFIFGLIFPIAGICYAKSFFKTGSSVGTLYSFNTVGSILGSLMAGFILIPSLGSTHTVILLAFLNIGLGIVLLLINPQKTFLQKIALGAIAVLLVGTTFGFKGKDPFLSTLEKRMEEKRGTSWMPLEYREKPDSYEVFFHKEGIEGTVTAFSVNEFKQLWINSVGMTFLCTETKYISHFPLLFVENPRDLLIIAFGMGTTVRSASLYPDLNITAVDLVPETFQIFKYYHKDAEEILGRDNVKTIVNDGRDHLLLSPKKYDVITVDPAPPIWSAGTVNLYTKEFFELAKNRLTEKGIMNLWFPSGTEDEVRSLVKTFNEVFPNSMVWSGPHSWGYYFIGAADKFDMDLFRKNVGEFFNNPVMLKDVSEYDQDLVSPEQLYDLLLWDQTQMKEVGNPGVIISDNNPFTEFPLWRYLLKGRAQWHPQHSLNIGNWKDRIQKGKSNKGATPFNPMEN